MKKVFSILLVGMLSACASQTPQPTTDVEDRTIGAGGAAGGQGSALNSGAANFNPLRDPNNILSKRSIYYDYDSYTVKSEYRELVTAHARYLRDNSNAGVLLQGNTDERGSREYNLALGQRRADSVKNIMLLSGARDGQVESVSLGEEKPQTTSQGESSWAQNRRTDILYRGE